MSDPEDDLEFLDEIRALEDVLAQDETASHHTWIIPVDVTADNEIGSRRSIVSSRGFGQVEPEKIETAINKTQSRHSAYETNKKLIELLRETRRELDTILEKCTASKVLIEEKISAHGNKLKGGRIIIGAAGMPYFKDIKQYPAPWNNDVKTKKKNGELQVAQLRYACPWTVKDRNILWRAIRQEAAIAILENERRTNATNENKSDNDCGDSSYPSGRLNLPKNFKAMIGPLGEREFDWLKIAAMDFDNRHTAGECRVMWQVFLHPDINRYRWTREEDAKMDALTKKYKLQDWDAIAKQLNTERSGYQCFIRYNSINRKIYPEDNSWTRKEEERLRGCVEKFKIGHYIPWGVVGRYMRGRTKNQVYYRWTYAAAPHLKKGRFTKEEDATFIQAIKKYGKDFGKISKYVMPDRSSVQLSDHYHTLVLRHRGVPNAWNINDDIRLLELYDIYGPDWSKISRKIRATKTRTQTRHRYNAIVRYFKKGISLYEIPRDYDKYDPLFINDENVDDEECEEDKDDDDGKDVGLIEERREREQQDRIENKKVPNYSDIDDQLMKYFQLIPAASQPGRKRKYYRDEELQVTTKKLYTILKTLEAHRLAIPGELEERSLTEKDKQLIKSLSDYRKSRSENGGNRTKEIQYSRIIDIENPNNSENHFTPVCSGDCNRSEKLRSHGTIDYQPPPNTDHCKIKMDMQMSTSTMIIDLIGDQVNSSFDIIMKILLKRMNSLLKPRIVEKLFVLGPPKIRSKIVSNIEATNLPHKYAACQLVTNTNNTKEKNTTETKRNKTWRSSICEGIIRNLDLPDCYIEPSSYTLLGLQHIISKDKYILKPELSETPLSMTHNGTRSMKILKQRLVQLFKYPIGLSHILPPEKLLEAKMDSNVIENNETRIIGEGITYDCAKTWLPSKKRKRL